LRLDKGGIHAALKRCYKGGCWRYICRIHPFGHHLKAGEVFLQGFEPTAVAAEDNARSGDNFSPTEESKTAFDFLEFAFFVHHHNDSAIKLNQLNKVASDQVVKLLLGFVGVLGEFDLRDGLCDRVDFYCAHIFFSCFEVISGARRGSVPRP